MFAALIISIPVTSVSQDGTYGDNLSKTQNPANVVYVL